MKVTCTIEKQRFFLELDEEEIEENLQRIDSYIAERAHEMATFEQLMNIGIRFKLPKKFRQTEAK